MKFSSGCQGVVSYFGAVQPREFRVFDSFWQHCHSDGLFNVFIFLLKMQTGYIVFPL